MTETTEFFKLFTKRMADISPDLRREVADKKKQEPCPPSWQK